jgi:hypothetical protein
VAVKRRTRGRLLGEYREGRGEPEEIDAPVEIETDPVAGVVRTRIRETEDEIRSHRAAIAVAYFQEQVRRAEHRDSYERRRIVPVPKPVGKRRATGGIPTGYVPCPDCSTGLTDPWDCARCEGRGIVRDDG